MESLDTSKEDKTDSRKGESTSLIKRRHSSGILRTLRMSLYALDTMDKIINLIFAILVVSAISSSTSSYIAATPSSASCTLLSYTNEAKQIKEIDEWRASYGYTDYVNAEHFPGCNAYLVTDSTPLVSEYPVVDSQTDQIENITISDYNGEATLPFLFDVKYNDYFDHISLYYVPSQQYNTSILVGIGWFNHNEDGGERFLQTKNGYDESTISTYNIYSGGYPAGGGYYNDYGPITSITTVQQSCTSCCHPSNALVGFSGYFDDGTTKRYFHWGVDSNTCENYQNCSSATFYSNSTLSGIIGSIGNASYFPSDEDGCNEMSDVAAINYMKFQAHITTSEFVYNDNLLTPYGYYPDAYLYTDIYNSSVQHIPFKMGCSDDPYEEKNMIDPSLEKHHTSSSMFLILCWLMALFCLVLSSIIEYQNIKYDESDLEDRIESTMQDVVLWKCCCKCWCGCCYGEEGYKGYVSTVLGFLQYAVMYPIGILGPYNSRERDFGCFSIWDGLLDDSTSKGMGIVWLVCFGLLFVYITGKCLFSRMNCCVDDGCLRCLQGFYEFQIFGVFFGSLFVLAGISIIGKVSKIENIAFVFITGVNFPTMNTVLKSIHVDGVTVNNAVTYFLGYQLTRLVGICFSAMKRLLISFEKCTK